MSCETRLAECARQGYPRTRLPPWLGPAGGALETRGAGATVRRLRVWRLRCLKHTHSGLLRLPGEGSRPRRDVLCLPVPGSVLVLRSALPAINAACTILCEGGSDPLAFFRPKSAWCASPFVEYPPDFSFYGKCVSCTRHTLGLCFLSTLPVSVIPLVYLDRLHLV